MSDTTFWPNYLFFNDFSDEVDGLQAIPLGVLSDANATLLSAMLSSHDKGEFRALWNKEEGQPYTLAGATVVAIGENHVNFPTNSLFSHIVVLQLPWAEGKHNFVTFQYNVPASQ
jgi:hypothetical protein